MTHFLHPPDTNLGVCAAISVCHWEMCLFCAALCPLFVAAVALQRMRRMFCFYVRSFAFLAYVSADTQPDFHAVNGVHALITRTF
jgi:hypothetical protein